MSDLNAPVEIIVIPFRADPPNHGQRNACLVELNLDTARMIPGTRVVLASVRDTGAFWK